MFRCSDLAAAPPSTAELSAPSLLTSSLQYGRPLISNAGRRRFPVDGVIGDGGGHCLFCTGNHLLACVYPCNVMSIEKESLRLCSQSRHLCLSNLAIFSHVI